MIPLSPYFWTAYLLGVLTVALILAGALVWCHLRDWRVSTCESGEEDVTRLSPGDTITTDFNPERRRIRTMRFAADRVVILTEFERELESE